MSAHPVQKVVQPFFFPAIALMNRLGYTRKFALLGLISLVAATVVVHSLYVSLDTVIQGAQKELEGLALVTPISRAVQLIQQHRGLSAGLLNGDESMHDRHAANEKSAIEAFDAMERKLPPDVVSDKAWESIRTNWENLLRNELSWTADENFAAHTRLINQIQVLGSGIFDNYNLPRDPDPASSHLIDIATDHLPDALEHLGQIRGYGLGIMAGKHASEQQKITINTLSTELGSVLNFLNIHIHQTIHCNPALHGTLSAASDDIAGSAQRIISIIKADIIDSRFATSPDDFYMITTEAIDRGYAQLYESLLPATEKLIRERIAQAKSELRTSIGIAFILFMVVIYFLIGIYYATIGSIRSLARSAHTFAGGDLHERVHLDTRDELSQVGDSFNEMADGFKALLEARKQAERQIWQQANYDILTGLPNRNMFRDRLELEIKKAHRASLPMALMFLDIDHFKEINDTLGHAQGDFLLVEAARRISSCVRESDTVARLGGDEFAVILSELDKIDNVERIADSIVRQLAEPFLLENETIHASASIGITLYPNDATELDELVKNADQAMYVAKRNGRNRHSYFTHALQEAAQARLRLISDLRVALADSQFRIYFQPIVDMNTGSIHKAEALIRWQHPVRGMVSPAEFIPLAEETGLILEIGDWVFHESARWAKRWRELYHVTFQISVNKSPIQFYKDGEEHSAWLAHLQSLDLPGQSIVVEITEGLLLDSNAPITGALLTLRDAGIQVAIDDFGTGYSSLSYLKKFDIDYLKIDQSFTRNLTSGSSDMALSEAIIVMAHKLGLKVIAEGVETEEQYGLLAAAGCDYAQGYLFSRPLPAEEFEGLLKCGEVKISPRTYYVGDVGVTAVGEAQHACPHCGAGRGYMRNVLQPA